MRGLRWRGTEEDGALARPERPRRCTLPITALRVMPPSSPAIWLAERPSAQSFLRSSTRSSVHVSCSVRSWSTNVIGLCSTSEFVADASANPLRRPAALTPYARTNGTELRRLSAARDVVSDGHKTTIWRDSAQESRDSTEVRISPPVVPSNGHSRTATTAASVWQTSFMLTHARPAQ